MTRWEKRSSGRRGSSAATFHPQEESQRYGGRREEAEALRPGAGREKGEHHGDRKQRRPGEIEPVVVPIHLLVVGEDQHRRAPQAQRDVHVENPAPGEPMDDRPAEDRTGQAGKPPDRAEDPLDPGSLVHVEEVAHDGHGDGLDGAGTQPLDRPEEDERVHAAGVTAEEGAAQEKGDSDEHHRLAAVEVRELAVDGQGHGCREHVGGEHPCVEVNTAQVPDGGGHRSGHDGHLHGGQEQAEEQRDHGQRAVGLARQARLHPSG